MFWAYLMWAQFLVIWYGNLPEETGFLFARLWGPWRPIGSIVFLGMFVIPFFGLLGVLPKKVPFTLGLFTSISLLSLWLERYLDVLPSVTQQPGPVFGLPELGPPPRSWGSSCCATGSSPAPSRWSPRGWPRSRWIGNAAIHSRKSPGSSSMKRRRADYVPADVLERRHKRR